MTAPAALTQREIQKTLRAERHKNLGQATLFYGSLEDGDFLRIDAAGHRIVLCPTGAGVHPQTGEYRTDWDGTTVIEDILGCPPAPDTPEVHRDPAQAKTALIHNAHDLAAHVVKRRLSAGVVQLTGDPKVDVELKRRATAQWINARKITALADLRAFNERAATKRAGNPRYRERMEPHEQRAQEFIDRLVTNDFDAYLLREGRPAFECSAEPTCGYATSKAEAFRRHLIAQHGLSDKQIQELLEEGKGEEDGGDSDAASAKAKAPPRKRR